VGPKELEEGREELQRGGRNRDQYLLVVRVGKGLDLQGGECSCEVLDVLHPNPNVKVKDQTGQRAPLGESVGG
jgi:hypothetical protein